MAMWLGMSIKPSTACLMVYWTSQHPIAAAADELAGLRVASSGCGVAVRLDNISLELRPAVGSGSGCCQGRFWLSII